MATNQSVTLFISYAHRDEELKSQLDKHLTPLKLQKVIDKWSDRQIEGGQDWAHQIDSNLKSADIILLLVSPDFVSSDYCAGIELKAAMTRYRDGDAIVVPVILEPCDWKWLEFGKLQATPKDGKAITDWANINSAFLDVTNTIRQVAQGLLDKRQKKLDETLAASERYKAKVEEVLSDGDITPLERKTLNELRDKLGLTADEAEAIKDSAYQPLREYQSKLAQYRIDLVETIQHEYPLSERTKVDLKQRQRELGLKAEDAERLEAELLVAAEASYQAQLRSGEAALQRAAAEAEAQRRARDAADQLARAEAEQRAVEAADRLAAAEAERRHASEPQRQAALAQARQGAEAMRAAEPPGVLHNPVQPSPAALRPAEAGPVVAVASAQPAISRQARVRAAWIGALVYSVAQVIGVYVIDSRAEGVIVVWLAVISAVGGAIAGSVAAAFRWIAAAAAACVVLAVASRSAPAFEIVMVLALVGGTIFVTVRRRMQGKK